MLERTLGTARFLATDPVRAVRSGRTPHAVIHREHAASVRYFPSQGDGAPVFVSMPLINTWSIFDLLPDRSVVAKLVAAGHPVYVLDWGRPGPEDSTRSLASYVDTLLGRALDRVCRHAGVTQVAAVGYCVGGTFLAAHLGLRPERVSRVCFLATPIDFHRSGRLSVWADPATFPLDAIVDGLGNFPKELMRTSFQLLKPSGTTAKWVALWERIDQDGFPELWAALEAWNADGVDFPGAAYREYVRGCYFDNALYAGGWTLDGATVDLRQATMPALVLACADDHIVPAPAAYALADVWGGPVTTETLKGGHVGVCVGSGLPHRLVGWLRG